MEYLMYLGTALMLHPEILMLAALLLIVYLLGICLELTNSKFYKRMNYDDVLMVCKFCDSEPDRLPASGMTLHKRLLPTGYVSLSLVNPPNLQCLKCGLKSSAYTNSKAI